MLQGTGHDGAAVGAVNRLTPLMPSWSDAHAATLGDSTETPHPTIWTPAPGAAVVLPERYTPTYAYPTLVWLAEPDAHESTVRGWLEEISTRNFVGIGLRPELYAGTPSRAGESVEGLSGHRRGLARFASLMKCVENWVRLHPQRRYVAGRGAAATAAVGWLLAKPDWFAGAIAIDAPQESSAAWRVAAPLAEPRRLLWLRSVKSDNAIADADRLALHCLGLQVTQFTLAEDASPATLAARLNRWVLEKIPTAILD